MKLNKHLSTLIFCGLLAALSMVLKRYSIPIGNSLRISFENTPVLLSGILFGPLAGILTGIAGDLLGCLYCGFGVIPVITLGMALVGGISGLLFRSNRKGALWLRLLIAVYPAHIVGNMLVKTLGIYWWYSTPLPVLAMRIPIYLVLGGLEIAVFTVLFGNRAFTRQLKRIGAQL